MGMFAETDNVDYRLSLPRMKNKSPFSVFCFSENKQNFAVSVFHLQQTNRSCRFY
jgi:hypothetical protein